MCVSRHLLLLAYVVLFAYLVVVVLSCDVDGKFLILQDVLK